MNRRQFIKMVAGAATLCGISPVGASWRPLPAEEQAHSDGRPGDPVVPESIESYREKMRRFDTHHADDIFLDAENIPLLRSCLDRFNRIIDCVGYANFHLLGFDKAVSLAKTQVGIGEFHRAELGFLEFLFFRDAAVYGFQGEKPVRELTHVVKTDRVTKVGNTGHFLYTGAPLELYRRIQRDIGSEVFLTSGIRGVINQFYLFMKKAVDRDGNLSLASRSLAPPGYSYHGVCDFDVGQTGFGALNFTSRFTETSVFEKLTRLKYVNLRYVEDNRVGVRFEPWHIKVQPIG